MTDLDRLRPLALTDPSAEAALNRELRRRDLPPEWTLHPSAPACCESESPQRDGVVDWGWDWVWSHLRAAGVSVEGMRLNDADRCDEDGCRLIPGSQGVGFTRHVIWPDGPYRHYLTAVTYDSGERRILCRSGHALDSYPEWAGALTRTRPYAPLTDVWYATKCYAVPASQMITVTLAPTLAPTHPLYARLAAVPGVEVDAIIADRESMHVHVILRRAPADPGPVWRAIADNLPVGILAEGSNGGVVDYEGGHSVRVAFSMSAGMPPA